MTVLTGRADYSGRRLLYHNSQRRSQMEGLNEGRQNRKDPAEIYRLWFVRANMQMKERL